MEGPNSRVWIYLLGVWLSDKTLLLVFNILLLGVWISNETLLPVFDILLLGVWISDETLPLVFDILLLGVLNISDETLFSCLIYCFSLFGYMLFGFLDIRRNTPSCVWCITSPYLDIRWNTPSRVSLITSLCFGNQMKHLSIQLSTMYSFRLFMQRKRKIQLWITFKSFVRSIKTLFLWPTETEITSSN